VHKDHRELKDLLDRKVLQELLELKVRKEK
jgi:hypothetical protein